MNGLQRFFFRLLPPHLAEQMRDESERWTLRCDGCGGSKSLWEVGGIRWRATPDPKRTIVRCRRCGGLRAATLTLRPK